MAKALDKSARRELISQAAARLRRREWAPRRQDLALSQACPICGAALGAPARSAHLHARALAAPARRAVRPETPASGPERS